MVWFLETNNSKNQLIDHLGVNKTGKNIRKSPLHQLNFGNNAIREQLQPQVYNINKNDFRNIVQQLTGSPSRNKPLPRPPLNPSKPQSMRLQKIRPPPLTPMGCPYIPASASVPAPAPAPAPALSHAPALVPPPAHYNNNLVRPGQYGQPSPGIPVGKQVQPQLYPPVSGDPHVPPPSSGLLYNPPMSALFSSRGVNVAVPQMLNPHSQQMNGSFRWPSPTGFMNLLSPRLPYPLLSPGVQFPPMTPNFAFSPTVQPGVLGPGPQPPPSSGFAFPLSPSGFFPFPSPRWSD
ncbi:hypothetical protein ES332_A08G184300v1 [Gossypium tomentosum]|uniref:VQ domain-containing protein n=1 Tax=Gossypium tomentosum TaxID=34277 RepID=A0A5D2PJP8_GOSTO|nr:hypothetical protein ES332_A08G184300v1 [Gossypium tomentosum]